MFRFLRRLFGQPPTAQTVPAPTKEPELPLDLQRQVTLPQILPPVLAPEHQPEPEPKAVERPPQPSAALQASITAHNSRVEAAITRMHSPPAGGWVDGPAPEWAKQNQPAERPNTSPAIADPTPQLSQKELGRRQAGFFEGRHYTDWTQDAKQLERAGDTEAAEILLRKIVEATEAEAEATGTGVAPYAYERLAVIARKRRDIPAELAILERFALQKHAPGETPPKLLMRLEKVRQPPAGGPRLRAPVRPMPSQPKWLSRMPAKVLFVDVETTGRGKRDRVVSIAAILLKTVSLAEGVFDFSFVHLICDPGRNSHPDAAAVHGYSDWLLRHQETFAEIAPLIHNLIAECDAIAAHNAQFDLSFIEAELVAAGLPPIRKPRFCTMQRYSASYRGSRSLNAVAAQVGLSRAGPCHGALEDAWLTMMIYLWLHGCPLRIPFSTFSNVVPSNLREPLQMPSGKLPRRKRVPALKQPQ